VAGPDVVVIGPTVEHEVSGCRGLAGVTVVSDLVGAQDVGAVVNLGVAVQFVDGVNHLLLDGANRRQILGLRFRLFRAGRIRIGRVCFLGSVSIGFGGAQLAGN
jgi:hypothetical protein